MEIDQVLNNLTELHQHLGSSSTSHFLWELAHEQGIRLPEKDYWKFIHSVTITHKTSQEVYHKRFDLTQLIQSSPAAIEKSVHYAISAAYRKSNVTTMEIRMNPMRRNKGGEHDLDKVILSAIFGMKKACIEYPVKAGLVLEMDRRFPRKQNEIIVQKAIDFKKDGIVGIDVSGPDNPEFKIDDVVDAFSKSRDAGLGLTIHTGEFTGSAEMMEVVEKLQPNRIGHGIHCVDNPELMKKLADKKIVLELCPTSNVNIGIVKDWDEIKGIITTIKNNNVLFTINSDSPEFLNTNVKKEFEIIYEKGILSKEDIQKTIEVARASTFIK